MNEQRVALTSAERKFDLLPKFGRGRRYRPVFGFKRAKDGVGAPPRVVIGKRRVKAKSRDGTSENERELAARMNWLRNKIAEAA